MSLTNAVAARRSNSNAPLNAARLLAAAAGMAVASVSSGAVITWTNTTGNNKFDDKLNWNPNIAVPGAADEAVIALPNAAATIGAGDVTLDKLTLNGLASTGLIVDAKNLKTKTAGAVTKGQLRLNGKTGGSVMYTAEGNGITVGNGGLIIMDSPASAGDVTIRLPGIIDKFVVNAGGELRVLPGAGVGGNRVIDGDFNNAGKLTVDKTLTIKYTNLNGTPGNVFVTNTGTGSVAANQFLNIEGTDPTISRFTMAGGKLTNAGNISIVKAAFNYDGGAIRNGNDSGRGGVNLREGIWSLNQNTGIFLQVQGDKSVAKTGLKGADQELYWNAAGVANPKMTFDIPAVNINGQNISLFDNKGKITFATGGNAMVFEGGGLNHRIVNNGKMNADGNGSVEFTGARFINNKGATLDVSADLKLTTPAAEPAAILPANGGTITFTRNGATLTTDRTLQNTTTATGISAASKGVIKVSANGVKATIQTPGGKVKGGDIDLKNITQAAPPAPVRFAGPDFTITDPARSAGSASGFSPATLTFLGGYEQEPDSVFSTAVNGLSPSLFDIGTIDAFGGLILGGTMNLFLEGFEPAPGDVFPVVRSDSFIAGTFDFGNGVTDLVYPIGGSGSLQFRVNYNVTDSAFPGSYFVTLTAEMVPTPGTATLMGLAGLIIARRRR